MRGGKFVGGIRRLFAASTNVLNHGGCAVAYPPYGLFETMHELIQN